MTTLAREVPPDAFFEKPTRRPFFRQPRTWLELVVFLALFIPLLTISGTSSKIASGPRIGIDTVADDGGFAFRVLAISCGTGHLGSGRHALQAQAGSQWCLAKVTMLNITNRAAYFDPSAQTATTGVGRHLSIDSGTLAFVADDAAIVPKDGITYTGVNPGVTLTAVLPFELPSKDSITSLSLHDSALSNGADVNVASLVHPTR